MGHKYAMFIIGGGGGYVNVQWERGCYDVCISCKKMYIFWNNVGFFLISGLILRPCNWMSPANQFFTSDLQQPFRTITIVTFWQIWPFDKGPSMTSDFRTFVIECHLPTNSYEWPSTAFLDHNNCNLFTYWTISLILRSSDCKTFVIEYHLQTKFCNWPSTTFLDHDLFGSWPFWIMTFLDHDLFGSWPFWIMTFLDHVSVEFGTDWIQINLFLLYYPGTIRGSSGVNRGFCETHPAPSMARPGLIWLSPWLIRPN